jgi:hypothetical protein
MVAVAWPPDWYPMALRLQLNDWFGADDFRPLPASSPGPSTAPEAFCPPGEAGWRRGRTIEGVEIRPVAGCVADNPWAVAAVVRGTNNVSTHTLAMSGLTADAVEKGADLDGDGDPDEIHIRLEVAELNGSSAEQLGPVTEYALAPGIRPGLWVFAPKLAGMATENFESNIARPDLRLPSPSIRVEQGDRVTITLENTHYMPHTLHLHGADHSFVTAEGEGNDGVPITSELPVMPGQSRAYQLQPRATGTMFYHCHVQPHVHVMMGLQGLFIIEANRPANLLQTLNIGAGQVRAPSVEVRDGFTQEYDLHYLDLDRELSEQVQRYTDPRLITRAMHREYDITEGSVDYFTLNGRSFPYTFRESLVVAGPDERIKLRVVNGGAKGVALHTHGHKFTVTHRDGSEVPVPARHPEDVTWLATSQRVELALETSNDGVHAYGPGIWPFHDHQYRGVTNDGIGPGGNISAIVYRQYIGADGWPQTRGVSWDNYFTKEYYQREVPVWQSYAPDLFSDPGVDARRLLRLLVLACAAGLVLGLLVTARRS